MGCWYQSTALGWLQIILCERFGHAFTLQARPNGILALSCAADRTRCIELTLDGATFTRADSDLPCTQWDAASEDWRTALPGALPAPGVARLPSLLIEATPQGHRIHYDVLGLAYWMLTRQEEVGRTDLDSHGRFPATSSHAYKHDYLERPIVDEWLYVLGQVIIRTWPDITLKQHQFSMKVSHDVDAPSRYGFASAKGLLRVMAGDVLKRGDIKNALRAPWIRLNTRDALHPSDPFNTFEWIMDLSDQHGLTSAFYFICGRSSSMDADYEPEHPAIRALMRRIHERGHEIGLHPSYGTYQKPELIAHEARCLRAALAEEEIQQNEIGGRMHYLRWEQPATLQAWSDAGMSYDSTLGYADNIGFRCGTAFPYRAFNPVAQKILEIKIMPLHVMETTLFASGYMGGSEKSTLLNLALKIKMNCRKVNGCFNLLWHNSNLMSDESKDFYRNLISQ